MKDYSYLPKDLQEDFFTFYSDYENNIKDDIKFFRNLLNRAIARKDKLEEIKSVLDSLKKELGELSGTKDNRAKFTNRYVRFTYRKPKEARGRTGDESDVFTNVEWEDAGPLPQKAVRYRRKNQSR